jgi:hypothetical protein
MGWFRFSSPLLKAVSYRCPASRYASGALAAIGKRRHFQVSALSRFDTFMPFEA